MLSKMSRPERTNIWRESRSSVKLRCECGTRISRGEGVFTMCNAVSCRELAEYNEQAREDERTGRITLKEVRCVSFRCREVR